MRILKYFIYLLFGIVVYYLLQIIGSFIEFGIFGSGTSIEGYDLYVPIGMVILQVVLTIFLKYKTSLFKNTIVYILMMIIPTGLLIYYYW